jgi:hypothetical protein
LNGISRHLPGFFRQPERQDALSGMVQTAWHPDHIVFIENYGKGFISPIKRKRPEFPS